MCKPCPKDYDQYKGKDESVKSGNSSLNWGEWTVGSTPRQVQSKCYEASKGGKRTLVWRTRESRCRGGIQLHPEGTGNFFFTLEFYWNTLSSLDHSLGVLPSLRPSLFILSYVPVQVTLFMALSIPIFPSTNFLVMKVSLPARIKECYLRLLYFWFSGHLVWFPQILLSKRRSY